MYRYWILGVDKSNDMRIHMHVYASNSKHARDVAHSIYPSLDIVIALKKKEANNV